MIQRSQLKYKNIFKLIEKQYSVKKTINILVKYLNDSYSMFSNLTIFCLQSLRH